MLDLEHDVCLYGISSRGFELAERYRDAAKLEHLPDTIRLQLEQIAEQREKLMEHFRTLVIEEGGLPKAGNPEREWLENLMDRWYSNLSGCKAVKERLITADQEWLDEIRRTGDIDNWPAPLAQALLELTLHIEDSHRQLEVERVPA